MSFSGWWGGWGGWGGEIDWVDVDDDVGSVVVDDEVDVEVDEVEVDEVDDVDEVDEVEVDEVEVDDDDDVEVDVEVVDDTVEEGRTRHCMPRGRRERGWRRATVDSTDTGRLSWMAHAETWEIPFLTSDTWGEASSTRTLRHSSQSFHGTLCSILDPIVCNQDSQVLALLD